MKTIVVFSGAGLSAESGIPTFRDSNGLWENHKVEDVATPQGWQKNPKLVIDFYAQRFHNVQKAQPNEAHLSLARLEQKYEVIHITQNIDDLLERAGCKNIIHVHGSLKSRKCEKHFDSSMLDGDTTHACNYRAPQDSPVQLGDLCPQCNSQLRPDVVWFEEPVAMPQVDDLVKEVTQSHGAFICVGTSAQVFPAGMLIRYFMPAHRKYIVDKNPGMYKGYVAMEGNATEQIKLLVDQLLSEEA
jgi:NAD-dependent deacetylase